MITYLVGMIGWLKLLWHFSSYGFGYGLRPKAEVFEGRTFGYGRRWKLCLWSNTDKGYCLEQSINCHQSKSCQNAPLWAEVLMSFLFCFCWVLRRNPRGFCKWSTVYILGQYAPKLPLNYVVVHLFPSWLVWSWAEIKITMHVALSKRPIN